MELSEKKEADGSYVIVPVGRIDTLTAPQLDEVLSAAIESGETNLVIDMKEVNFVSSAGLRVIIVAQKKLLDKGSIVFKNTQQAVLDVFEITGFTKVITLE